MAVVRITEAWVRSLPPGSGQFTDATLPGFMLVSPSSSSRTSTMWVPQRIDGKSHPFVRVPARSRSRSISGGDSGSSNALASPPFGLGTRRHR